MVPLLSVMVLIVYFSAWETEKRQKKKKTLCVYFKKLQSKTLPKKVLKRNIINKPLLSQGGYIKKHKEKEERPKSADTDSVLFTASILQVKYQIAGIFILVTRSQ